MKKETIINNIIQRLKSVDTLKKKNKSLKGLLKFGEQMKNK